VYHDIPEDLRLLVEPIVHDYDCELVDVIERRSAAEGLIRIIIDQVSGDGRVSIENIESISREVEVQLDFVAAVGSKVSLQTRRPIESRKRFKGMLMGFENGFARLEVESGEVQIPFGEVEKANSIYQFSRDDFAGGSTGGASK